METLLLIASIVPYVFIMFNLLLAALADNDTKEIKAVVWAVFWLIFLVLTKVDA
jgi:hypothetical protein